jgi:hypothetical protein
MIDALRRRYAEAFGVDISEIGIADGRVMM